MSVRRRDLLLRTAAVGTLLLPAIARAAKVELVARTPMPAPDWALLQRELLARNAAACEAFYATYVDRRGWLKVFERWGANDGPDDAAEATNDWALLHALGGSDRILTLTHSFWEGHLQQYAAARTVETPAARQGMYHREFPVQMDWQHNSEGLTTFNSMGLSAPRDAKLLARTRRYADFYTGRDPSVRNYDPRRRVMRSVLNGSRGPMLREATPLDWAGDPFEAGARFHMEHGETSYQDTLDHYAEYSDVVGDNPLNLQVTTLGLNAYALGAGERFRRWALDYLDAWVDRARANGDMLPSKVGLDGRTAANWWGGTYGWGFSPIASPGKREDRNRVPRSITAFFNGTLLTGDSAYVDLWRRQTTRINNAGRQRDGKLETPTMYGAEGWYGWKAGPYRTNGFEIWYVSQRADDREAAGDHPWVAFLEGRNAGYPVQALNADLQRVADRVAKREHDTTTPDTRLADWPIDINPASVTSLIQLMTGGMHIARPPWSPTSPNQGGVPLHCRLRYFDADRRRAGVPEDVAALVHAMGDASAEVTLINLSVTEARTVIVQGGAYAEHRIESVVIDGREMAVGSRDFTLRLEPGCGTRLRLAMRRYANRPTLAFPWDR